MNEGTLIETIGLVAATLTTVSFFPQVIKTWRSGGEGLSYGMLLTFFVGSTLWLVYGLALGSSPVIFANAFTALQVLAVVVIKRAYPNRSVSREVAKGDAKLAEA